MYGSAHEADGHPFRTCFFFPSSVVGWRSVEDHGAQQVVVNASPDSPTLPPRGNYFP